MVNLARIVMGSLTATNDSYVIYEAEEDKILTVEEINLDEFINHCVIAQNQYSDN
jgi:hypothetical protein